MDLTTSASRPGPSEPSRSASPIGFSLVYLLAAGKANGIKQHIAIDPFQMDSWHGIGALKPARSGWRMRFGWFRICPRWPSPPSTKRACGSISLLIHGNHRFDDVLVDFTLCDLVCEVGGHIIFDDMWMPSILRRSSPSSARTAPITGAGGHARPEYLGVPEARPRPAELATLREFLNGGTARLTSPPPGRTPSARYLCVARLQLLQQIILHLRMLHVRRTG